MPRELSVCMDQTLMQMKFLTKGYRDLTVNNKVIAGWRGPMAK